MTDGRATDGACPECGAVAVGGRTCQDLLHDLLERKYAADAAEYGLVVACYTLQHPARQSVKALEWAHFHLALAVQQGLPLQEVRRAARARFDQGRVRATAPPLRPTLEGIRWRMTITRLAAPASGDDAARSLEWARTILEDLATRTPDGTSAETSRSKP
jgi:hypothetical protein